MEFDVERILLSLALFGTEWVLWLLIVLSVIALAVVLNRSYYFLRANSAPPTFLDELQALMAAGDEEHLHNYLSKTRGVEAKVVMEGIRAFPVSGPESAAEAMQGSMMEQKLDLERYLVFLGTLGNNAPFIGLLGTVLGIIRAFYDLSLNPAQGSGAVMSGISEALVATALGLLVAIPSVITYNYFQQRIKKILSSCQISASALLAFYQGKNVGEQSNEV
jgi:biopolymer transport protein ExbB